MDGPGYTSASSASAHTATSHRRKLIKKPPSYFGRSSSGFDGGAFDAQSLESKRSSQSLKRAPSAPPARSNPATVSDWQDSDRSHPQLSANSNTLRPVPSPISPQGDLTPANHWAPVPRHSDRLSDSHLRPLNSPGIHDDLIGAPFDGGADLHERRADTSGGSDADFTWRRHGARRMAVCPRGAILVVSDCTQPDTDAMTSAGPKPCRQYSVASTRSRSGRSKKYRSID